MPPQLRQYQPIDFGIRIPQNVFTTPANTNIFYDALDEQTKRANNEAILLQQQAQADKARRQMETANQIIDAFQPNPDGSIPSVEDNIDKIQGIFAQTGDIDSLLNLQQHKLRQTKAETAQQNQYARMILSTAKVDPQSALELSNTWEQAGLLPPGFGISAIRGTPSRTGVIEETLQGIRSVMAPFAGSGDGGKAKLDEPVRLWDMETGYSAVTTRGKANQMQLQYGDLYTTNKSDLPDSLDELNPAEKEEKRKLGQARWVGIQAGFGDVEPSPQTKKISSPAKVTVGGSSPMASPLPTPTPQAVILNDSSVGQVLDIPGRGKIKILGKR